MEAFKMFPSYIRLESKHNFITKGCRDIADLQRMINYTALPDYAVAGGATFTIDPVLRRTKLSLWDLTRCIYSFTFCVHSSKFSSFFGDDHSIPLWRGKGEICNDNLLGVTSRVFHKIPDGLYNVLTFIKEDRDYPFNYPYQEYERFSDSPIRVELDFTLGPI